MNGQTILNYARPGTQRTSPDTDPRRFIVFCGVGPLAVGLLIFLLWLVTRANAFVLLGFIWLGIGTIVVIAGAMALLLHILQLVVEGDSWLRVIGEASLLLCILLVNFPAAGIVIRLVYWINPNLGP